MSQALCWTKRLLVAAVLVLSASAVTAQGKVVPLAKTTHDRPEQFGTQDYTVTVIQASSFTSDVTAATEYGSLYRHFEPSDSAGHFYAGVEIPAGVVVDFVGLQLHNDTYYPYVNYQVNLFAVDQHSGTTSGVVSFLEDYQAMLYTTTYNATPLAFAWNQNAHQALVVDVYQLGFDCPITEYCREDFGLGWVEIWWKRAISPAPATPSFTDVPASDSGFQYIEALKASGITGGCAADRYCPDASLTRRQMAIFLSKALGLHWPN